MALFKRRQDAEISSAPTWIPKVDLVTAKPVIFALANAPVSNEVQVRSAIAGFVRLSETPSLERAADLFRTDRDVCNRPWIWLAAVMREGAAAEDDHLVAAALFWACYWTSTLVPKNNLGAFIELNVDPIPPLRKAEIHGLGVASASRLPEDFVIVGNETGKVQAGPLATTAGAQLGM